MHVNFSCSLSRGDTYLRETAVSFHDLSGAWNSKPVIRCCNCTIHVVSPL